MDELSKHNTPVPDTANGPLHAPDHATTLVHAGQERSRYGETSEALYLTSGFVYDTAQDAEARFKGEQDGAEYRSRSARPSLPPSPLLPFAAPCRGNAVSTKLRQRLIGARA